MASVPPWAYALAPRPQAVPGTHQGWTLVSGRWSAVLYADPVSSEGTLPAGVRRKFVEMVLGRLGEETAWQRASRAELCAWLVAWILDEETDHNRVLIAGAPVVVESALHLLSCVPAESLKIACFQVSGQVPPHAAHPEGGHITGPALFVRWGTEDGGAVAILMSSKSNGEPFPSWPQTAEAA